MRMNYFKQLCLLLSITTVSAFADTNSIIHWPHHGDKVMKTHYEYVDVPVDTTIWDFSHAIESGDRHEMRWINLGDTLLVKIEQGVQSIYQLHGDSLFLNGYETSLVCVLDSIAPVDVLTALAKKRSISTPMYFHGSYSGNHAIDMSGAQMIMISEPGTLILPNDTLDNICCVTTTKDCLVRVSENKCDAPIHNVSDSLLREVDIINQWYSPVYRFPLAENMSRRYYAGGTLLQESEITYLCVPDEQEYSLGVLCDPETMLKNAASKDANYNRNNIKTNNSLADCLTVLQNCDRIDVTVNGFGNRNGEVSVLLCDVQGRVWYFQNGNVDEGCWQCEIVTTPLPPGYYLLQFINENEKHVERIMIK